MKTCPIPYAVLARTIDTLRSAAVACRDSALPETDRDLTERAEELLRQVSDQPTEAAERLLEELLREEHEKAVAQN